MPINFKLNNVSVKDHIGKAFLSVVCIEKVHSHGRIRHPPPPLPNPWVLHTAQ